MLVGVVFRCLFVYIYFIYYNLQFEVFLKEVQNFGEIFELLVSYQEEVIEDGVDSFVIILSWFLVGIFKGGGFQDNFLRFDREVSCEGLEFLEEDMVLNEVL